MNETYPNQGNSQKSCSQESKWQEDKPPRSGFKHTQYQFAAHLRDPELNSAPSDVEDRRMGIYRDLIYGNIEGFISAGFPILRQLFSDSQWQDLVRGFLSQHASQSPYFLKISEEFLKYLQEERATKPSDPPFMLELAHYEWVELALDASTEQLPEEKWGEDPLSDDNFLSRVFLVSPLAWCLSYQYPVHLIGPDYRPQEPPEQATFLIVYRNRNEEVNFMESNAVTLRLLSIFEGGLNLTGRNALVQLAAEMQHPKPEILQNYGAELLLKLQNCHIVFTA